MMTGLDRRSGSVQSGVRADDFENRARRTADVDPGSRDDIKDDVARAVGGDVEAFERLYRRHVERVLALCVRMTGDRQVAEELTQDVWVTVWRQLRTYRGDSAFSTWLHRVAATTVLQALRARSRRWARLDRLLLNQGPGPSTSGAVEERMDLEKAIASLPDRARCVYVLHDIAGYSHSEIGVLIGAAEGTSRAHLWRARKLLRTALTK